MTELEEHIIAFVAEATGIEPNSVELDSRLAQEIGMDGDDAEEFFVKFAETFHVDLTALRNQWHQHFQSEGCLGAPPLGCGVVSAIAVVAGGLIHIAFNGVPAWASIITLLAALGWACRKVFHYYQDDPIPVTVRDLVDAAVAGRWVKHYEQSEPKAT